MYVLRVGWGREEWRADRHLLSRAVKTMLTIGSAPRVRFRTNTAAFCTR